MPKISARRLRYTLRTSIRTWWSGTVRDLLATGQRILAARGGLRDVLRCARLQLPRRRHGCARQELFAASRERNRLATMGIVNHSVRAPYGVRDSPTICQARRTGRWCSRTSTAATDQPPSTVQVAATSRDTTHAADNASACRSTVCTAAS